MRGGGGGGNKWLLLECVSGAPSSVRQSKEFEQLHSDGSSGSPKVLVVVVVKPVAVLHSSGPCGGCAGAGAEFDSATPAASIEAAAEVAVVEVAVAVVMVEVVVVESL